MSLLDYILGERRGKDAHRLEKEAMGDPFLADALDGFHAVEGDHGRAVERLRGRIEARACRRHRGATLRWSAAAAILLLGVGGGGVLLRQPDKRPIPIVADLGQPAAFSEIAFSEVRDTVPEPRVQAAQEIETPRREKLPAVFDAQEIVPDDTRIEASLSFADFDPAPEIDPAPMRAVQEETAEQDVPPLTKTDIRLRAEEAERAVAAQPEVATRSALPVEAVEAVEEDQKSEAAPGRPVDGMEAFRAYVRENLLYPQDADGNRTEGRVLLEFRVDRRGRPAGIRVIESFSADAAREARRLLEAGPDWTRSGNRIRIAIDF